MDIECFMLYETEYVRRELRRYASSDIHSCSRNPMGYCNESVVIIPKLHKIKSGRYEEAVDSNLVSHNDERWPKVCHGCGYAFQEADYWQINDHRLFENPEHGIITVLREAPEGAMWWASWADEFGSAQWKARGGGSHLFVMTPGGREWDIDSGASGSYEGSGWERTGDPPKVTVTPSILTPVYHGFLTNGILSSV